MDMSSKCQTNKATEILNDTIEQLDLIDIFRTLHPKTHTHTHTQNTRSFQVHMEHSPGLRELV